jgi:hypothetical protein
LATSTPRTALRLPTADICGCHSPVTAVTADTVTAGAVAYDMYFFIMWDLNPRYPKIPPKITPMMISMMTIRLVILHHLFWIVQANVHCSIHLFF